MSTNTTAVSASTMKWAIPERYKVFLQQGMVLLVVVLLAVFFTIMKPNFASWSNISSLLLASVVTGVQALGLLSSSRLAAST